MSKGPKREPRSISGKSKIPQTRDDVFEIRLHITHQHFQLNGGGRRLSAPQDD